MAALAPAPKFYEHDENGAPLAGGFVYTYISGTTTPLATYTDAGGGTANTNPVVLDSAGRCNMWLLTDYEYKFVVTSATGTPVYTVNNIAASATLPDVEAYIDSVTTRAVNTMAALRLLSFADWQRAYAFGYYAKGDGGGGSYYYDSTDTTSGCKFTGSVNSTTLTVTAVTNGTVAVGQMVCRGDTGATVAWITALGTGSGGTGTYTLSASATVSSMTLLADNGGSVIVASDGGRWKLTAGSDVLVEQFGANGANDSYAAEAAFNASSGKTVLFQKPSYLFNTAITTTVSDLSVDFGSSTILNTVALPVVVIYGEDSNAVFNFTGNRIRINGGYFKDGASEGIRITGVFNSGDTYTGAGYTTNHYISDCVFDNWTGNSVQIRFFKGAIISGVLVRNKGTGDILNHHPEIAMKYGTDGKWIGNSVEFSDFGGAIYGLYVGNSVASSNYALTTNSDDPQSNVPFYFSFCDGVVVDGNISYAIDGGMSIKCSHGANITIANNRFQNTGTSTNPYACIFMQGVDGFDIVGNYCKGYAQHVIRCSAHPSAPASNSKNGLIANNDITAALNGTSRTVGDGIYCAQDTSLTRGGIVITGNRLLDASIYVDRYGGVDVPQSRISDNSLTFVDDPATSGACIWATTCYGLNISDNWVHVDDSTVETKIGIRNTSGTYVSVNGNYVAFVGNGTSGSVSYLQDGSPTANTVWWELNRQMRAETPFSGATISRTERVSFDYGDADGTLYPENDARIAVWNTPLTGNRSVSLSTTGAFNGTSFRVVRTAAATGAFNLNVGSGPLKALAVGQWCDVVYNGSAWTLVAFGSL